jgi:hypothetical protein
MTRSTGLGLFAIIASSASNSADRLDQLALLHDVRRRTAWLQRSFIIFVPTADFCRGRGMEIFHDDGSGRYAPAHAARN